MPRGRPSLTVQSVSWVVPSQWSTTIVTNLKAILFSYFLWSTSLPKSGPTTSTGSRTNVVRFAAFFTFRVQIIHKLNE